MNARPPAHLKRKPKRAAGNHSAPFWLACFLTPIALLVIVSIWNGVYPFGTESFLTEDLKFQYIDFFTWYREVLLGERNIFYSFSQALGSNTWGLFSYYLASPFNLLIVLFDENHLVEFVYLITALKLGCIQVACAWFLTKRFSLAKSWTFLLSLCFVWCSWVTTQMRNPMWLDALILLPFMAYAAYLLIRTGRMLPLALCTAADVITCWYMAYISILFTCLYVLFELACYLLDEDGAKAEGLSTSGLWILKRALRFTGALMLGLLLSAWTFVPTVLAMMGGSSVQELGGLFRCGPVALIKGFLPGLFDLDKTPQFFTGTVTTILALVFLGTRRINGKLRLAAFALMLFLVLSSWLSPLEYIWCGFRVPNGFYSRTTFLASFFAIWMAGRYLQAYGEIPASRKRFSPHASSAIVCIAIVTTAAELLFNAHVSWQSLYLNYPQEAHDSYVTEARTQLKALRDQDTSPFYRIEKAYTRVQEAALNEGTALGYDQISSYSSANNPQAIQMLHELGYSSPDEFLVHYTTGNIVMDSLLGVRYASSVMQPTGYETADSSALPSGATFYRNPYALSLGVGVDKAVANSKLTGDNPFEQQNELVSALLGRDVKLYTPITATSTIHKRSISWNVTVPANTIGYSYVIKGKNAGSLTPLQWTLDNNITQFEGWRFDHAIRPLNDIQSEPAAHTISLSMTADTKKALPKGTDCLFYALDYQLFQEVMDELSSHQLTVDSFADGHVTGTYQATGDEVLLLSVPYDRGWTIKVNGTEVDAEPAFDQGMMAIPVQPGNSTIEMTYRSPGFLAGCVVSGITLIGTVGISVARRRAEQQRKTA